jgi:hypothetical protein
MERTISSMISSDEYELLSQLASGTMADDGLQFYEEMLESLEARGLVRLDRRKEKIISATATSAGTAELEQFQR